MSLSEAWSDKTDQQVIEDAVAAERERCAKIAEGWTAEFDKATGGFAHPKLQAVRGKCGDAIAAAIRSGK